ncbi:type I toxin-antitoxin system Hok family toxin [Klebsiella pneumoniae subsp. pneumoniae]|nr:type I toxin-antitoxin system Hok family toxin [Klebsiella pneumoniae subsp. pneumoniae]
MLTKYALVAIIVLCITVLDLRCWCTAHYASLSIKERNIEFKTVLAYESKK